MLDGMDNLGTGMGDTVIYRSLKAFGLVVEEDGREFVILKTYVDGSDKFNESVDSRWTLSAAPITGHAKFNCDSLIIVKNPPQEQFLLWCRWSFECSESRLIRGLLSALDWSLSAWIV